MIQEVDDKLLEFKLAMKHHIFACVTDGARVILRLGLLIESEHQFCYAHDIHLTICDVLYNTLIDPNSEKNYEKIQDEVKVLEE